MASRFGFKLNAFSESVTTSELAMFDCLKLTLQLNCAFNLGGKLSLSGLCKLANTYIPVHLLCCISLTSRSKHLVFNSVSSLLSKASAYKK